VSDNELKELMAQLLASQAKTDAQIAKTDAQLAQTDAQLAKTDAQLAKTDAQLAKTDAQLAKTDAQLAKTNAQLGKTDKTLKEALRQLGGIGQSQGEVAEEYFYNALEEKKEINAIHFDAIAQNFYNKVGDIEGEYDIVLINGKSVAIVETKYKLKDEDVVHLLNKQIPNFKILFPMYKEHQLYAGIAGFKIPKATQEKAIKNGLFVLKRKGEVMESVSQTLRVY